MPTLDEIKTKAIAFLKANVPEDDKKSFRLLHQKHGERWIAHTSVLELPNGQVIPRGHFQYGMMIRNKLRDNVFKDGSSPIDNWDDHYVDCLEQACDFPR